MIDTNHEQYCRSDQFLALQNKVNYSRIFTLHESLISMQAGFIVFKTYELIG